MGSLILWLALPEFMRKACQAKEQGPEESTHLSSNGELVTEQQCNNLSSQNMSLGLGLNLQCVRAHTGSASDLTKCNSSLFSLV